jgi:serine O-acetyltransferase
MIEALRRDRARYSEVGQVWYRHAGFWVGATYRLGAWASDQTNPVIRIAAGAVYRLLAIPWRLFLNVEIPARARIGPGLCLIHPHSIIIGDSAEIGEDCLIFHEVTLGRGVAPGLPRIGKRVQLFVGVRVLGPVVIGDGSKIGANCVITRSVPPGSVVVPAPNRIIPLAQFTRMTEREPSSSPDPAGKGPLPETTPDPR